MINAQVLVPMRVVPPAYAPGIVEAVKDGLVRVAIYYAGNRRGRLYQSFPIESVIFIDQIN